MARPVELGLEAIDLARWVRPGDGIVWGQACAEPVVLVDSLLRQAEERGASREDAQALGNDPCRKTFRPDRHEKPE